MNVLLISQCDKRALTESRRILDQFAERRGDRTWQTPITRDGLSTLHQLLRKSARKNTAVACHWIRGAGQTELLWIVGDRRRFNDQGAVPTNTTQSNILRRQDENDWHFCELIQLLTDLAGLLHDLGKATEAFQRRLRGVLSGKNLIRHEWTSLRLFEAFVGPDDDATWLDRLSRPDATDVAHWTTRLQKDGQQSDLTPPFAVMANAPLAQAVGWLIVTHHRLPQLPDRREFQISALPGLLQQVQASWNESHILSGEHTHLSTYWDFPHGLPVSHPDWHHRASRIARRLLATPMLKQASNLSGVLNNPFVMHLSRLSLMLADHHYSRLSRRKPTHQAERVHIAHPSPLQANTLDDGTPNQSLDEHLLGVARHGAEVARFLPNFERHLPRLIRSKPLRQRTQDPRYRWQNQAADLAFAMRTRAQANGAFIVNMASTGCGKTLGNARIMHALADPAQGMRCSFALGLRTLTLQTGHAFRDRLHLSEDELAIRVGGAASRTLFELHEQEAEATGSASSQALLDEASTVIFEGNQESHPLLRRAIADQQVRNLILAPILVCTIDHLTPATESQRGGRQIAPMLRLLSSDLVLDEPDDFDLADLPALTRLVHWAGLLGAKVLLSSATLPPDLVQGLFEAYRNGRHHYQRNRGEKPGGAERAPAVACAWIDEFEQHQFDCAMPTDFEQAHARFAKARHTTLTQMASEPRRRAALTPLADLPTNRLAAAEAFASAALTQALKLHQANHSVDRLSQKRVSFGLIRMANVEPLYDVALRLFQQGAPAGCRIHLCVYHSQFPLLVRSFIEQQLDTTLQRHPHLEQQSPAVFSLPEIRARLDSASEPDQLFIVLGSPVTEVGRDHDYDWAVVEPSSMRSLIQLAGRVRRHRPGAWGTINICVFSTNLRHFRAPGKAAYCRPGFELEPFQQGGQFYLASHDLHHLLTPDDYAVIDARPRIVARARSDLLPRQRWVDLEHARMQSMMLPIRGTDVPAHPTRRARGPTHRMAAPHQGAHPMALNASTWWSAPPADALLTAVLQQQQPFREDAGPADTELVLLPTEDGDAVRLYRFMNTRPNQLAVATPPVEVDRSLHHPIDLAGLMGSRIQCWGVPDYLQSLAQLADKVQQPLDACALRFGRVRVPDHEEGWSFHPALGFAKRRHMNE